MNTLLIGKKLHFNGRGFDPQSRLDSFNTYSPVIGFGLNHSIGLNELDCANRYSRRLRDLIKLCLLREPLARPSSTQLVQLATEGLECIYNAMSEVLTTIPPTIASRNIPFLAIPRPEPQLEWEIEILDDEMDMLDVESHTPGTHKEKKSIRGVLSPLHVIRHLNSILGTGPSSSPK
jgi:hypothetical protein